VFSLVRISLFLSSRPSVFTLPLISSACIHSSSHPIRLYSLFLSSRPPVFTLPLISSVCVHSSPHLVRLYSHFLSSRPSVFTLPLISSVCVHSSPHLVRLYSLFLSSRPCSLFLSSRPPVFTLPLISSACIHSSSHLVHLYSLFLSSRPSVFTLPLIHLYSLFLSSCPPVFTLPLQAQVFLNQLYKTPVELRLNKNPDLRAIRFASFNPILDPWIYILLRKAVLLKLIEKIKYIFCKMGARRQRRQGSFHCVDNHQLSSALSNRDSHSLASTYMQDFSSSFQTFLYLPEGSEVYKGTCHKVEALSVSQPLSVRNSQASHSLEQGSVEVQSREGTTVIRDCAAPPCPKEPALQVSLSTDTELT